MKRPKFVEGDEVEFKIKGKVSCIFEKDLADHILVTIDRLTTILVDTKNKKVKKIG